VNDTITLHGVSVELNSDLGREFTENCVRAGEGLISDRELSELYELTPADFQDISKDTALIRALRTVRDQRVRSGRAAREAAAKHFVRAPNILSTIMDSEQANPKHKIESIRELRQIAIPENQNSQPDNGRFIIQINLGSDTEIYNKSIAVTPDDIPPDARPKLTEQPKLTIISDDGFENG
jgi:hypothetical protein